MWIPYQKILSASHLLIATTSSVSKTKTRCLTPNSTHPIRACSIKSTTGVYSLFKWSNWQKDFQNCFLGLAVEWNFVCRTVKGILKSLWSLLPGKLIVMKSKLFFLIVPWMGIPSPWKPIGKSPSAGQPVVRKRLLHSCTSLQVFPT